MNKFLQQQHTTNQARKQPQMTFSMQHIGEKKKQEEGAITLHD